MQGESGMQENNQEKQVVKEPIIITGVKIIGRFLVKLFFSIGRFLMKLFFSPSTLWSIFLLSLFVMFFLSKEFRVEHSGWFFDGISKITGKSSTSSGIHIHGEVDAMVSRPFKDATQACWYYHANYENSHPYTVLWNKPDKEDSFPKIRVIAESAYWQAEKCTKENGQVKLAGIEYTKHTIEAQFEKNQGFVQIATSDAYYRSAIFFDKNNGRITERKVLANYGGSDFEYESSPHMCDVIKEVKKIGKFECSNPKKEKHTFKSLKERNGNFNILEIRSDFDPRKDREKYRQAIMLYIEEREELHTKLAKKGCGAISIEPELTEDPEIHFQTSIAFLCLKGSGTHSHVRLMHRINESKF